ncbi:MAG: hypothetical protein IJ856_07350, partial [Candidatus Methanomethylophilaceae archaeon]|nr:hypothetical protein [Candidatus Methanomethylophilaceae archaeon]
EAVSEAVEDGADRIIVVPFYFAPGKITDGTTLERVMADEDSRTGSVEVGGRDIPVSVARMFITYPSVKNVILSVCRTEVKDKEKTGIMMVGHGSRDGHNLAIVRKLGDAAVSDGFDVICCSNEFDEPSIQTALREMSSRKSDIVVIPMFISPNKHSRTDVPTNLGLGARVLEGNVDVNGKTVHLRVANEIGLAEGITKILAESLNDTDWL